MTAPDDQPPEDDTGWADYHAQMFDLNKVPPGSFLRWKIQSSGVNIARQLAEARNRGLTAWTEGHGPVADWSSPHPPTVLWMPYMAYGACFGCTWLENAGGDDVDGAAGLAGDHASGHLPAGTDGRLLRVPLAVWRRDAPWDAQGPSSARGHQGS